MKHAAVSFGVLCVTALLAGGAGAAVQLGVRGGYAHAEGDLFPGSGNMGGNGLYGVAMAVDLMPAVGLEVAWERYQKDFHFDEASFENSFFGGSGSYEDQAYLVTGKLHLPLGGLLGLYAGGGGALHRIDLSVESDDPNVQDYVDHLSDQNQDWEWHVLAGAQFSLPVLPLLLYGEYRFQNVTGDQDVRYNSVYAGLNLVLK
jgi:opacity protein-like surface antigen